MNIRQPGQIDRIIVVETPSPAVPDGAGGFTHGWQTKYGNVWAKVERLTGSRLLEFGNVQFGEMYEITIRNNWIVAYGDRLAYRGKPLTIHTVDSNEPEQTVITAWA